MSLFKKRKESAPSAPQFADEDPNSPLRVRFINKYADIRLNCYC